MPSVSCPPGWTVEKSTLNCPKLINSSGEMIIYFIPLNKIYSICARNLEPTIPNFLSGTPLDIQSMAYEINGKTLEGELGFKSLEDKLVRVNNFQMAREYLEMKGQSLDGYMKRIAKNLNFATEIIDE